MEKSFLITETTRLYRETPLIESIQLGNHVGCKVYLKMENSHPAGSFKLRGISHACQKAVNDGFTRLVSSSGGSAGLAVAYSARQLGVKAHIVVPKTTGSEVIDRILDKGSDVDIHGEHWSEANKKALQLAKEPGSFFVHPFDDPIVWEGHSSMIEEIAHRMDEKPIAIVTSVGGGGLACGVLQGLEKVGWADIPLVAMETIGADSFHQSIKAGKMVVLPEITSVAICLGAAATCQKVLDYSTTKPIISEVVEDREAVNACLKFADDHRVLVDPACGASLAAAYGGLLKRMRENGDIPSKGSIVIIVCGGNDTSLKKLADWKIKFNL